MDAYDRKARLYPAATVAFPLILLGLILFSVPEWWRLITFAAAGGLSVLVIQVVGDLGAGKQDALWASWGGPPTTVLLRWKGKTNLIQQQQRHKAVEVATTVHLPTLQEERADPAGSDALYETAVDVLRAKTRSGNFELVRTQNANYGFRRNLYACRPLGIGLAALVFVAEVVLAVLGEHEVLDVSPASMIVAALFSALWIAGLIFVVSSAFVRRSAERYAQALILAASTVQKG